MLVELAQVVAVLFYLLYSGGYLVNVDQHDILAVDELNDLLQLNHPRIVGLRRNGEGHRLSGSRQ